MKEEQSNKLTSFEHNDYVDTSMFDIGMAVGDITPAHSIILNNPEGKELIIDFSGDKVIVTGELEYNEAAKLFFEALDSYFQDMVNKKVEERLLEKQK